MEKEKALVEVKSFVKLVDLTMDDVKKGQKDGSFILLPVTFKRSFSKKGSEQVSINVEIHKPQLSQLRLQDGNDYLKSEVFHSILLATETKMMDEHGRELSVWKKQALCRFVKGSYTNREGEYYSLEVVFKQGHYVVHFFTYDQVQLIKLLEEKGIKKFNWNERPDKIDFVEQSEAFAF